ncbi:MAG: GNAT family N-acetyltransferase [Patescibacteria group bacterium]
MDIEFKKITIDDWELARSLEEGAASDMFAPCDGEEGYKKYIGESQVYAIINGNKAIGTISYKNQDDGAVLVNGLTVMPEYRGQGIASLAMNKLLDEIGNKNCSLVVHPGNTPAILIYLHFDFCITGWKDNYFGDGEPRLYLQRKVGP